MRRVPAHRLSHRTSSNSKRKTSLLTKDSAGELAADEGSLSGEREPRMKGLVGWANRGRSTFQHVLKLPSFKSFMSCYSRLGVVKQIKHPVKPRRDTFSHFAMLVGFEVANESDGRLDFFD